jgi:hypothetical protein
VLGGRDLVRTPTFPRDDPRVQLDHLVALGGGSGSDGSASDGVAVRLPVGDHRALVATLRT